MVVFFFVLPIAPAIEARAEPPRPECVAPAKPGGGFDLTCRIAQSGLSEILENPLQVTFMPRGVGAVAFALFNTSRTRDANSIVAFSTGSLLNIVTGKFGQWSADDVQFIATIGTDFGVVVVRGDSEHRSLASLMRTLQALPASLVIGAGGSVGSQDWMKAALLMRSVRQDPRNMRYVSYEGGGEAATALLGGHIDVFAGDFGEMKAHIGDGKFRVLAVLSEQRLDAPYHDIPTAVEQGFDLVWPVIRGFYVGGDVASADVMFWVDAFDRAFETTQFNSMQKELGLIPFNYAGAAAQTEIAAIAVEMRALAIEMGLIQ